MQTAGRARQGRGTAVVAASALSLALLVGTGGAAAQVPGSPGEVELFNLEHVYNFDPEDHDPERHSSLGSDLEFFTHEVPLRDYGTGQLLDADGTPLSEGADPVLAERDFAVMGSYQRGGYVFDITDPEAPQFVSRVTCRQNRNDVGIRKFTDPETGETRVVLALTQQSGMPCADTEDDAGVGVQVNAPEGLSGFYSASQWTGTAAVDDQTAELVYVGTGCSPADYAGVDVEGKIALTVRQGDEITTVGGETIRECPAATFFQKMQSAERAGAIGLVQVDDDDEVSGADALSSGIPGLELLNRDGAAVRDAVLEGAQVEVTLTEREPTEGVEVIGEGSGGLGVFDITDPYEWRPMYRLLTGNGGVHNFIFHPTAPYGYLSNGALPGLVNEIPIVDFSDLDAPELVTGVASTEGGVHDIEFSPEGDRAYAASEHNYRIYDTTDPVAPVLLSRTPNVGTYAHAVFPSSDRELMVTNNESLALGGFFAPGSGVCPGEGLASYDITDEGAPQGPLAYYTPNVVGQTDARACTSHFGRFAPDTRILSMGWYIAGTRIVDWSDPANPVEVAAAVLEDTETWAAKFHEGPYVYVGDLGRGFDVFRWSGEGPAPWLGDQTPEPTPDVEVACENCPIAIRAGETGAAEVVVHNTGDVDDTYQVTVDGVPDHWTATPEPDEVSVEAGDDAPVTVTVEVPRRAQKGTYTLTVSAASADHDARASTDVDVDVHKGRPSSPGSSQAAERTGSDEQRSTGASDEELEAAAASRAGRTPAPVVGLLLLACLVALGVGRRWVR